jgi:putative membrane protein
MHCIILGLFVLIIANGYGSMANMMNSISKEDMTGFQGSMIIPIILIGVVICVIYNQGLKNNGKDIGFKGNSIDILNERFARGEISEEEYNTKIIYC